MEKLKVVKNTMDIIPEHDKDILVVFNTDFFREDEIIDWFSHTIKPAHFLIKRDGVIVQLLEPQKVVDVLDSRKIHPELPKRAIFIGLVGAGGLEKKDKRFIFFPFAQFKSRYFEIPEDQVIKIRKPLRGYKYFQGYSDEQKTSLSLLLKELGKLGIDIPENLNKEGNGMKDGELIPGMWFINSFPNINRFWVIPDNLNPKIEDTIPESGDK